MKDTDLSNYDTLRRVVSHLIEENERRCIENQALVATVDVMTTNINDITQILNKIAHELRP